jgi:hypothetical protein
MPTLSRLCCEILLALFSPYCLGAAGAAQSDDRPNATEPASANPTIAEAANGRPADEQAQSRKRMEQARSRSQGDGRKRPDLSGVVQTANRQPVSGALVSIYSAGVRVGTSPYCPTCYADCGKRVVTDGAGAFTIERLDPTLVFRVLVVAKGYEPQFVTVDPLEGKPMAIEVKSRPALPDDRRGIVSGEVIGPDHEPLTGALVEPYGCKSEKGRWFGRTAGIDPLAVTDDQGRFEIATSEPVEGLDLQITARAMATKKFPLVPSGAGANRLQLSQGATICGRVLNHDRPVPGILVGLVLADRSLDKFNGLVQIGTDAEGRFSFSNAPADEDFFVYGIMSSVGPYGAIGPHRLHAAGDGGQTDAGDLTVEPAYRIAGRLALSDGKLVPAHTRVLFNRQDTRDTQSVEADASGGFSVGGIPSGIISISASVPGYRTSEKNRSLDRPNGRALQGLVKGDIDGLIMLFEPGKPKALGWPTSPVEQDAVIRSRDRVKIEPPFGVTADLQAPAER